MAVFDYGDALLVFEVRGLVGDKSGLPNKVANEFYTTDGVIRDGKFYPQRQRARARRSTGPRRTSRPAARSAASSHAVRSRKPEDVNANAEVAHYSAALCHLANISYRLGKPAPFDKAGQSLGDNKQVVETFDNLRDNLKAIGVNLDETNYTLGRHAAVRRRQAEKFVGDGAEAANPLLSRAYRAAVCRARAGVSVCCPT